ncbi:MAG: hypothetical protein J6X84_08940 [Treponema sp.]|nr:hypothetical protein [Treponema sp.]
MKNKEFKYSKRRFSSTITYKLSVDLNVTLSVFCFLLITLYTIGNYQNFQDKNQNMTLSLISYTSIFNMIFSFILIVETVIKLFTEKYRLKNIIRILILISSFVFCMFCSGTSNIISCISGGNL